MKDDKFTPVDKSCS